MNRLEIDLLQTFRQSICVTITLPTHRTSPENKQDPIRLRNLVREAQDRLLQQYSRREVGSLIARLQGAVEEVDFRYTLDGLALFATPDFVRAMQLPFSLKERVVIEDSFFTRDLVFAMNRTPRYWVLVLSEKPTRLYEGTRDVLIEVKDDGFPRVHEGPGGAQPLPGGFGIRKSAYRDEYHRQFFREVDTALRRFMLKDPLPLMVVGVDRHLAFFKEVTTQKDAITATLTGSHDKTSPSELAKLVWPLLEANLAEQRRLMLSELDKSVGERKVVSTVGEVWRHALDGRGRLLLVEQDLHYPARVDESGRQLVPAQDPADPDAIEDAVDEIIENVLARNGRVAFMENGQLRAHQRMALILRY